MTENEDYFKISKNGPVHTLSDRIPFRWKELMIWTSASFVFLIWFLGIGVGLFVAILTLIGYTFFRFAAWVYYSEIKIDLGNGKLTRLKKVLNKTQSEELITERFDPKQFEFKELVRSGKTKFLLNYKTHKNNELLVLRTEEDKKYVGKYFADSIK